MAFIIGRKLVLDYDNQLKIHNPNRFVFCKSALINIFIGLSLIAVILSLYYIFTWKNQGDDSPVKTLIRMYLTYPSEFLDFYLFIPFFEEILFRGIYFNLFVNSQDFKNRIFNLLMNSFIFAIVHFKSNVYMFLSVFVHSIIYGLIYLRTKNIKYPIFLHMIFNVFLMIEPLGVFFM